MSAPLRVLLVGELGSPHLRRWAEALTEEVDLHVAGFGDLGSTGSCTVHHLGDTRTSGDARFAIGLPLLAAVVRRVRPAVVHAHYLASYGVMAAAAAGRRPLVHSAWGSDVLGRDRTPRWHRTAVDRALRRAVAVTYDSDDVAAVLARLAPDVPRHLVVFGPPASWTRAARRDDATVLAPRLPLDLYRPEVQLRAFAMATGGRQDWTLEVLSSGHDVSGLERLAADLHLGERVRFRPRLDREQMLDAYLRSPVTLSIPRTDATAASLLEAMAAGSLPVVSDLPANRHLVDDGVNGLVVPVDDVVATAAAIRRAIEDQSLRGQACTANRTMVAAASTWEASVARVVDLYRQVAVLATTG
jgi:glycosyltransferase involved in cell wall biosynthesis